MHSASQEDIAFRDMFEAGQAKPDQFHHADHLRLGYTYLCELDTNTAHSRMRAALLKFLSANGVPAEKYHETLTFGWLLALRHFMDHSEPARAFDAFLARHPRLTDTDLLLSHYSREHLFSTAARAGFVEPDLAPFPSSNS